ncbi:MAG TPA: hypothetical protein VHX36_16840 [Candidatus Acidoferrales bacterium]|nr:hypothetical protein [Candidatus Acidoferrales bacterium]
MSASRGINYSAPFSANGFSGSGATLQQLLDPVPPPGFDYQYLSAVDSDLAVKAFIDPVTQLRVAAARRFLRGRGFGGGYYILDGGGYYYPDDSDQSEPVQQPAQQQPQIIVLQQGPPAEQAAQPAPEAAPLPEAQALPDVGEFVLVLRNGTRIQAVAFTSSNGNIVYITADGSRRMIAAADLDSETTVRVNDERGTPLQLSL